MVQREYKVEAGIEDFQTEDFQTEDISYKASQKSSTINIFKTNFGLVGAIKAGV